MDHLGSDLDDAALVRAVQAGEPEAFDVLFRRHYATVRRVCARRLASVSEAEEVTQASFVRAYERIDQCNDDRRFGAWVQVIAFRLCADAWRVRARTTPVAEPPSAVAQRAATHESCEDALLRSERAAAVRRALSALPPRQREVIVARDLEGRRPREVAAALAVSVGAVDSLLLRARRRMVAACRATGEQGGVSTQLSTTSLAATSAASSGGPVVRPLVRMVESVTAVIDAAGSGAAVALGLGSAGPTAAQRVAGLVGAGALLIAPLSPGGSPGHDPRPAAPGSSALTLPTLLPGVLTRGLALPAPAPVTAPGVPALPSPSAVLPTLALPSATIPPATVPEAPRVPALPVPAALGVLADAGALTAAAGALVGTAPVAGPLVDSLTAVAGSAAGLVSAAVDQLAGTAGGSPDDHPLGATDGLLPPTGSDLAARAPR